MINALQAREIYNKNKKILSDEEKQFLQQDLEELNKKIIDYSKLGWNRLRIDYLFSYRSDTYKAELINKIKEAGYEVEHISYQNQAGNCDTDVNIFW